MAEGRLTINPAFQASTSAHPAKGKRHEPPWRLQSNRVPGIRRLPAVVAAGSGSSASAGLLRATSVHWRDNQDPAAFSARQTHHAVALHGRCLGDAGLPMGLPLTPVQPDQGRVNDPIRVTIVRRV
jgi:hypothetical protein